MITKILDVILDRHKVCHTKWDYEHSGYNGLRPYCQTCKVYKYPNRKPGFIDGGSDERD